MVNQRIFNVSDDLFSYYQTQVDLEDVNSIDEIVQTVVLNLQELLKKNNLESLTHRLSLKKFHIHGTTFAEILLSEPDNIFFVCGHCDSNPPVIME
tara:strand:+ start:746 stop:1033 length:288 start_codon:yes stop_codon:yes gene_type:complete